MSSYFLGQIGIYGFNFAPRGWALASGNILSIAQNTALFSLLGTTYGGNGQTTFGLPDMRSRTPLHFDGNYPLGEMAGTENVTLLATQMPSHTHPFFNVNSAGDVPAEGNHVFAQGMAGSPLAATNTYFKGGQPNTVLNAQSTSLIGGNQPHNNIQPCLAVNFCIATTGIYPSRN